MESNLSLSLRNKGLFYLVAICLAILPFQLKVLAFESEWGRGFSNPYSSVFFTIFDGFLLLSGLWYLAVERKKWEPTKTFFSLLIFSTVASVSLLFSPFDSDLFHLLLLVKLMEPPLFYSFLRQSQMKENLIKIFVYSMCFQAIWGTLQVLTQSDAGLQIVGETQLSDSTAQLAKITINGWEFIRAYGTFPHPNVLGGFLAVSFLLTWDFIPLKKKEKILLLSLESIGLLASFSRSALLALLFAMLVLEGRRLIKKKRLFLIYGLAILCLVALFAMRDFNLLSDPAVVERLHGYVYSFDLLKLYPFGIGFSHYTLFLDKVSLVPLMPWEYQPVHNIFVLLLVELGIPLFVLFLVNPTYLFVRSSPNKMVAPMLSLVLVLGLFDHYLLTLEQGRLLIVLVCFFLSIKTEAQSNKNQAVLS